MKHAPLRRIGRGEKDAARVGHHRLGRLKQDAAAHRCLQLHRKSLEAHEHKGARHLGRGAGERALHEAAEQSERGERRTARADAEADGEGGRRHRVEPRRRLLELFDPTVQQSHERAAVHLEHVQVGLALQEGGQIAHARLEDVGPHRGRAQAPQRWRRQHGPTRILGGVRAEHLAGRCVLIAHERRRGWQPTRGRCGLANGEQVGKRLGMSAHEGGKGGLLEPQLCKAPVRQVAQPAARRQ